MKIDTLTPGAFWGKLHPREDPTDWHPLLDHCLDVASVARAIAELPTWQARLAGCRLAVEDPTQRDAVAVLIGLHDIGKFSPCFQWARTGRRPMSHVDTGLQIVRAWRVPSVVEVLDRHLSEAAASWLQATVCHHGKPRTESTDNGWPPSERLDFSSELEKLFRVLFEAFPGAEEGLKSLPQAPQDSFDDQALAPAAHALCGLTVLADWVGSNTHWFPYRATPEEDRIIFARRHASIALDELGLRAPRRANPPTFADSFPEFQPRGLQQTVTTLPLPAPGSVTIFEAATGSGKTEAALHWFARLQQAGFVDGLYFALPMRTAAVQLQERVSAAMHALHGDEAPPTVLAVPGYYQVDAWKGQSIGKHEVRWEGPVEKGATWASEAPMRFLAAPIGVGTIDQLLLSSLKTKWAHLRGACSLRQLLVIDEVHASDVYMSELLWQVVDRQRRAGGHVLLLSATLGSRLRVQLQSSNRRTQRPEPLPKMAALPYPCVWTGDGQLVPTASTSTPKTVTVTALTTNDAMEAMCAEAFKAAQSGARVLVIRNTVRDATQTLECLRKLAPVPPLLSVNGIPAVHHSRFAPSDRKLLDRALLHQLGPQPKLELRAPVIAVATQTAEQSLDLDADLLITDLCPMDVLLQRIGRVHRHEAQRPPGFERARAIVVGPAHPLHQHKRGQGLGSVYEDLPVLECTRRLIEEAATSPTGTWTLPADNRALVERATHAEAIQALVDEVPEMANHVLEVFGKRSADKGTAQHAACEWTERFGFSGAWNEPHKTRLGLEAVHLEIRPPIRSPFVPGVLIHAIDVPQHMLGEGPYPDDAHLTHRAGLLSTTWSDKQFNYSAIGLETR